MTRRGGALVLNAVAAIFGTLLLEEPLVRFTHVGTARQSLLTYDVLTSIVALGVGFSVYLASKSWAAKWIWPAGVLWFLWGAARTLDIHHFQTWEFVATGSTFPDMNAIGDWSLYMLTSLRVVCYSLGAVLCAGTVGHRKLRLWSSGISSSID